MGNVGLIVAPAIAGYLIARAIGKSAVPPLGVAAVCGAVAAVLSTGLGSIENASFGPVLIVPAFEFSGGALLAITVPMVLLTVADGNLQGFGYLQAQGFRAKANALTIVPAILAAAQRALEASFAGSLRLGPMVAFAVAASSITAVGLSAPIWALVAGLSASLAGERASLQGHWKSFEKKEA